MFSDYSEKEREEVAHLLSYPDRLDRNLGFMKDTDEIELPEDPIERVVFQERAQKAIRKIAQNKGHILLVGKPGTGKSMLADMFKEVVDQAMGDYLRPKKSIAAYPGKDRNHVRITYANPERLDYHIDKLRAEMEGIKNAAEPFSLKTQIASLRKARYLFIISAAASLIAGFFFPVAFVVTGLSGIGAIFMFMQENNHAVQEKIQNEGAGGKQMAVKQLLDRLPEVLYDPRKEKELMTRVTEPSFVNMRGGFRHDPYQSGNLGTPAHQRAYLGAHATSPIIYIDELKTLINAGYMPNLLEIMQNQKYFLEGGKHSGSGAADRSEDPLLATNIIIACCNHDTLSHLRSEGDGAFLSRVEDKGEIIQMEHAVPETPENLVKLAQYIKQESAAVGEAFQKNWGDVFEREGYEGVRKRSEKIYGRPLPRTFKLKTKAFTRSAVAEIVKELRCRASDRKLSAILRPINGIIRAAVMEAVFDNAPQVEPGHVSSALNGHMGLEGELSRELMAHKKDLKKHIGSLSDAVGFVVGLSVVTSGASGQMFGQPLPIRCQVNAGGADSVISSGKTGEIAKAAAQNVRAAIKKIFQKLSIPYIGYEMHVEYIQAHGGVEGDSASIAMDVGLISDFIHAPVNQRMGITGSLTGDIILAVGGVPEKVRSIMHPDLDMAGACVPWQNRHDIEPLIVNTSCEAIFQHGIPGLRIFREPGRALPFDIYFLKTRYHAYQILMGIDEREIEAMMIERSRKDLEMIQRMKRH
jgi:Lon-like ATP-dependent protease